MNTDTTSDFLAIALAARARGFTWITPLKDKEAFLRGYNKRNMTATETECRAMAADFPHQNAGIVSRGGVGNVFFFDIDKPGVLDRLQRETGRTMPETYVCKTRPSSKPWKEHYYFIQTEYFVKIFPKQVQAGEYDLKGNGGGGYVRAEGCISDGEQVTGNGKTLADIPPIPDWLVDWLRQDAKKLTAQLLKAQREKAAELAKDIAAKAERDSLRMAQARRLQQDAGQNVLIPKGHRNRHLRSRAGSLVSLGVRRELVFQALLQLCEDQCEDGYEYARTPKGQTRIKKIAYNRSLIPGQIPIYNSGLVIDATAKQANAIDLFDKACRFPASITAADAYKRLGLDKSVRTDQHKLKVVMRDAGYRASNQHGGWVWDRVSASEASTGYKEPINNTQYKCE